MADSFGPAEGGDILEHESARVNVSKDRRAIGRQLRFVKIIGTIIRPSF